MDMIFIQSQLAMAAITFRTHQPRKQVIFRHSRERSLLAKVECGHLLSFLPNSTTTSASNLFVQNAHEGGALDGDMNAKSRFGEAFKTGGDCTAKIPQRECKGQTQWRDLSTYFRCGARCVAAAYSMNNCILS